MLQDWTHCENTLQKLLDEARRDEGQELNKKQNDDANDDDEYDSSRMSLDLSGFTSEEIFKLVKETRRRIAKDKAVYKERSKKVFKGIGAKLDQIGASEDRPVNDNLCLYVH